MSSQLVRQEVAAEKFFTVKDAAHQLGLPYWKLNQAVKRGLVPSHSLLNSRKLVRLSEIVAALTGVGVDVRDSGNE